MIAALRLAIAVPLIFGVIAVLGPVQVVSRKYDLPLARKIPNWFHRILIRTIGLKIRVHGTFSDEHPLFLVSNHVSWLDIPVMGSVKELSFIAKSEVSGWPLIAWLAKMQGTVFVNRHNSRDAVNQADTIASRLLEGDAMVLFAEGTTGDGTRLMPFKSSLLGAAQYAIRQSHIDQVSVQPVAIFYSRLHGMPLGRRFQNLTAWPGDVPLGSHAINILRKSAFDVDVVLGEPLDFTAKSNRKTIAREAHTQVSDLFSLAMKSKIH